MNAVELLAEIIAQRAKVSTARLRSARDAQSLRETGYLKSAGVNSSVACEECSTPHDAEIIFLEGQYGYFCPDLGFLPKARADVHCVAPDLSKLIAALAEAFQCKRRKSTPVHGATWRIGTVETDHGSIAVYFHPVLRDEIDMRALSDALSREVKSAWTLIVTAQGALPVQGAITVNLSDLVELDANGARLLPLTAPGDLVGVPLRNPGGAPNRYGVQLTLIIEERLRNGKAVAGRNKEANAVLSIFRDRYPDTSPPSLSSVKDYVSKARAGQ